MAKESVKKERERIIKHPPKAEALRINLRIRDQGAAKFLLGLGKTERTTILEYAFIKFMRTNQDDPLLQIYNRGGNWNAVIQSAAITAKEQPRMEKQPLPVARETPMVQQDEVRHQENSSEMSMQEMLGDTLEM